MDFSRPNRIRQFFATAPTPCPYMSGRVEQKLVIELKTDDAGSFFGDLARAGFRRSHGLAYRPACKGCNACVPVRIPVETFQETRSMRRISRLNSDLTALELAPNALREHFDLFKNYLEKRHSDSDMAEMGWRDYCAMIENTSVDTAVIEHRTNAGQLMAVCLIDLANDSLSAVYSFFKPEERKRSLGKYIVLELIRRARDLNLDHVYLGYWIAGSNTMDYKRRFPGLEAFRGGVWVPASQMDESYER
jgi:arginyl-tRNA--protein-N-Asp/Glu arginylyltransferase